MFGFGKGGAGVECVECFDHGFAVVGKEFALKPEAIGNADGLFQVGNGLAGDGVRKRFIVFFLELIDHGLLFGKRVRHCRVRFGRWRRLFRRFGVRFEFGLRLNGFGRFGFGNRLRLGFGRWSVDYRCRF